MIHDLKNIKIPISHRNKFVDIFPISSVLTSTTLRIRSSTAGPTVDDLQEQCIIRPSKSHASKSSFNSQKKLSFDYVHSSIGALNS